MSVASVGGGAEGSGLRVKLIFWHENCYVLKEAKVTIFAPKSVLTNPDFQDIVDQSEEWSQWESGHK